jgi:hypothetical protein
MKIVAIFVQLLSRLRLHKKAPKAPSFAWLFAQKITWCLFDIDIKTIKLVEFFANL